MKKTALFNEKICVTASSQDSAHRAPVSFVMRRGVVWAGAAILVLALAFCVYTAVHAADTVRELTGQIQTLGQTLEVQNSQLEQYEQQLDELQQGQPAS